MMAASSDFESWRLPRPNRQVDAASGSVISIRAFAARVPLEDRL
jgi:hypothetical protein